MWLLGEIICSCQSKRLNAIELLINRLLLKYKSFWHFMALSQIINVPGPRGNAEKMRAKGWETNKKWYLALRKGMLSQNRPNELVHMLHYCRLLHESQCVSCSDCYIVRRSKGFRFLHSDDFIQSDKQPPHFGWNITVPLDLPKYRHSQFVGCYIFVGSNLWLTVLMALRLIAGLPGIVLT